MNANGDRRHELIVDAAAYVLSAMDPDEATRYHAHLVRCAECRNEVAALTPVIDALAASVPQFLAPPTLRDRLLRSIKTERMPSSRRCRDRRISIGAFTPRPIYAAAMTITALAAALLVVLGSGSSQRRVQAHVQNAAGQAELELSADRWTLFLQNFPKPAPGHIYEIWLQRARGKPAPTRTLFSVTATGAGEIGLSENLHGIREILVTQEPDGGSTVSTHRPLIVAPVR